MNPNDDLFAHFADQLSDVTVPTMTADLPNLNLRLHTMNKFLTLNVTGRTLTVTADDGEQRTQTFDLHNDAMFTALSFMAQLGATMGAHFHHDSDPAEESTEL